MDEAEPKLRAVRRSLPIALLRARETVMAPLREMMAKSDINEQKWRVLRVVQENGPMELSAVAHEACILQPSLTRMIRPMEEDGLIARQIPKDDRRKVVIRVTEAGEALIRKHAREAAQLFDLIEREIGKERLETLLDLLEDVHRLDLRPRLRR